MSQHAVNYARRESSSTSAKRIGVTPAQVPNRGYRGDILLIEIYNALQMGSHMVEQPLDADKVEEKLSLRGCLKSFDPGKISGTPDRVGSTGSNTWVSRA